MSASLFPSKFAWPLAMREQYGSVIQNPGIHYWFPNGKKIDSDNQRNGLLLPQPLYDGYTMRLFIYAAGRNGGNYGVFFKGARHYSVRLIVSDGAVTGYSHNGYYEDSPDRLTLSRNVAQRDIYTVSMQIEGDSTFRSYFNNHPVQTMKDNTLFGTNYIFWVHSEEHLVLSLHFSRERGSNTNFISELHLTGLKVKIGSYVVQEFTFNGKYADITVYIRQNNGNGRKWTNATTHVFATAGKLQQGERVRCTARIIPGRFLVSMSFELRPQLVTPDPNYLIDDQLELGFSDNTGNHTKAHFYCP